MSGPKFDPTINLGHISMLAGLLCSVLLAYGNLKSQAAVDEQRISTLETAIAANASFQSSILNTLGDIKVDIGVLKSRDGTQR